MPAEYTTSLYSSKSSGNNRKLPPRSQCYCTCCFSYRSTWPTKIEADSLKFLLECGFKATEIATMISVSLRTIQRRMAAFDLRGEVPRYTPLSNEDLEEMCREITREFLNCGVRRMRGFLLARNVRISWEQTREAMRRIDPEGVLLRSLQLNIVHWRVYSLPGALALWHMDGNHKLIR